MAEIADDKQVEAPIFKDYPRLPTPLGNTIACF